MVCFWRNKEKSTLSVLTVGGKKTFVRRFTDKKEYIRYVEALFEKSVSATAVYEAKGYKLEISRSDSYFVFSASARSYLFDFDYIYNEIRKKLPEARYKDVEQYYDNLVYLVHRKNWRPILEGHVRPFLLRSIRCSVANVGMRQDMYATVYISGIYSIKEITAPAERIVEEMIDSITKAIRVVHSEITQQLAGEALDRTLSTLMPKIEEVKVEEKKVEEKKKEEKKKKKKKIFVENKDELVVYARSRDVHPLCVICKRRCKKPYEEWNFDKDPEEFCKKFSYNRR